jgi:hypothetical protein
LLWFCHCQRQGLALRVAHELHGSGEALFRFWAVGISVDDFHIVAAFEVDCTSSIYSGLLRMSDFLALQPNINIRLYIVAPDDRRDKVEQELLGPTFALRERPLPEVCGFLPFWGLLEKTEGIRKLGLAASLKPESLEKAAEFLGGTTEYD